MTTEKQREAARANGAKSRGPVTAEGKARSSKNATTHGLTAETVVLPGESEERFHTLLESMIEAYAPSSDYGVSLVKKMAALNWQQDRLLSIDTVNLGVQMEVMAPALEAEVEHLSTPARIALAYRELSDTSRVLPNLDRHASRIRRQFNQLRTELLALQKGRNEKLQNEPTDEQTSVHEQHTAPETEPGTSATDPAAHAQPVQQPSSDSDCYLPFPESASKLQNEPTSEQAFTAEQHTHPETVPGA